MKLSVVLPVYAEKETIKKIVQTLKKLVGSKLHEILLVVSQRSPKETMDICNALKKKYAFIRLHIQKINPGLGHAVREGLALVRGTHVLIMDSDGETDPRTVPKMIKKMEQTGCDVVLGSRWMHGGEFRGYHPAKLMVNWLSQQLCRLLFFTSLHDLSFGFKLLKREVATNLPWKGELHEIATETTLRPLRAGYHIEEVPTRWVKRTEGESKNTFWRTFRYVQMAWRIWSKQKPIKRP